MGWVRRYVRESKRPHRSSICQGDFSFDTESLAYIRGETAETNRSHRCDRGQIHTQSVTAIRTYDGVKSRWTALQASGLYERRAYPTEVYRNSPDGEWPATREAKRGPLVRRGLVRFLCIRVSRLKWRWMTVYSSQEIGAIRIFALPAATWSRCAVWTMGAFSLRLAAHCRGTIATSITATQLLLIAAKVKRWTEKSFQLVL